MSDFDEVTQLQYSIVGFDKNREEEDFGLVEKMETVPRGMEKVYFLGVYNKSNLFIARIYCGCCIYCSLPESTADAAFIVHCWALLWTLHLLFIGRTYADAAFIVYCRDLLWMLHLLFIAGIYCGCCICCFLLLSY